MFYLRGRSTSPRPSCGHLSSGPSADSAENLEVRAKGRLETRLLVGTQSHPGSPGSEGRPQQPGPRCSEGVAWPDFHPLGCFLWLHTVHLFMRTAVSVSTFTARWKNLTLGTKLHSGCGRSHVTRSWAAWAASCTWGSCPGAHRHGGRVGGAEGLPGDGAASSATVLFWESPHSSLSPAPVLSHEVLAVLCSHCFCLASPQSGLSGVGLIACG